MVPFSVVENFGLSTRHCFRLFRIAQLLFNLEIILLSASSLTLRPVRSRLAVDPSRIRRTGFNRGPPSGLEAITETDSRNFRR